MTFGLLAGFYKSFAVERPAIARTHPKPHTPTPCMNERAVASCMSPCPMFPKVNGLGGSAVFRIRTDAQPGGDMLGFLRLMQLKGREVMDPDLDQIDLVLSYVAHTQAAMCSFSSLCSGMTFGVLWRCLYPRLTSGRCVGQCKR